MSKKACTYCGTADELRPYGPGGLPVCFDCAMETPERKQDAENAMQALMDASEAVSPVGIAVIGNENGPVPFDPDDLKAGEL